MSLMNGARLGISAQGLGIAQAAYLEGLEYAAAREQFGKAIIDMPLVYEMLISARVNIEAARMLTYETSRVVDIKKSYDHLLDKSEKPDKELKQKSKYYTSLAALLTPVAKYFSTELANRVAYDMLQIHGGTGYMRDFNIERHYRDARITNIYEGTTQLQFVAAIGGVVTRVWEPEFDRMEAEFSDEWQKPLAEELKKWRETLSKTVDYIREKNDHVYQSYYQDKIVDMATRLYIGYLFVKFGIYSEEKKKTAAIYFENELPVIDDHHKVVISGKSRVIEEYADLLKVEA
jgi:hypothetical protein